MKKNAIIILTGCLLMAIAIVITLTSMSEKKKREPGSFTRNYPQYAAVKLNELDFEYNSYYLAGVTDEQVFLANTVAPLWLLVCNTALTDTQLVRLQIKNVEKYKFYEPVQVKIAAPYFYITDGHMPGIFRGKLGEWIAEKVLQDTVYFTQIVPINKSSFGVRTMLAGKTEHVLGKVQKEEPHEQFNTNLLQKQVDGFFCTDGLLNYSSELKRLVYTYYYRNQFIVYDTNLNLDYRGHTIDTFSRAQVRVEEIKSEGSATLISKKMINIKSFVSGNYLFILSSLLAKNDTPVFMEDQAIFDVYDLRNNTYRFSFCVPNRSKEDRLRDFIISNNRTITALFDHHAIVYELQRSYLP